MRWGAAILVLTLTLLPGPLRAQDTELERSRKRLEEIRKERDRLQQQQERLQGQVHDVNDELHNLERQRESTQRIVDEIERQIGGLSGKLDRTSAELILAEDNLGERRAVLERRLVDIYKRGALYTFQALLAAESFGDLLSRYKYLYLTSRQDRALVGDAFDGAMVGWGARNLADLDAGLREAARVLKPGARLVILEMTLPPNPALRRLFLFYFHRILPWIGRAISKHTNAYTWLPESTRTFPAPAELARRLEQAGFQQVGYQLHMGGVTAMHVGTKSGSCHGHGAR